MLHTFTVYGVPAPKGNKSAFPIRKGGRLTGRVAVVEKGEGHKDWSRRVEEVVQAHAAGGAELLDGPLALAVRFYLPRPVSEPKRRRTWPQRKPDLDKLIRALLDPMSGVLIADDARIVELFASKDFAEATEDPRPRAVVSVWNLSEGEGVNQDEPIPGQAVLTSTGDPALD